MSAAGFVLGTAGHIDHGKSALVKALTGIDPDRLDEEKRRGMTIDLGFAYHELPSGRRLAIVDVPGHQRFLKNMLAGVHGMDAVMLVIAADEGPMPQTREHLAIIDLLRIGYGVVVLSKADLVEPGWLSLVRDETTQLLNGTALQDAPIIAVSSKTGQGLDELRRSLDDLLDRASPRPDLGRARLPIDRSFAIAGFGTVVTGTLVGGSLTRGSEVAILPQGRRARIRGLQQHNQDVGEAHPGTRTAVNLSGLDHSEVERGNVLALPGVFQASRRLDVRITVLPEASPLQHRDRLLLYHGTAEQLAEVSLLDGDQLAAGRQGFAQLFLSGPLVAADGDRFILRIPSPPETVAGGIILDVAPRRHRRHDQAALAALASREVADPATSVVLELSKHPSGLTEAQLSSRLGRPADQLAETLRQLQASDAIMRLGTVLVTRQQWLSLSERIHQTLQAFHQSQPLRRGMPREELRSRSNILPETFTGAMSRLTAQGLVVDLGPDVALSAHRPGLSREQEATIGALLSELEAQPFSPPPLTELTRKYGLTPALLKYLVTEGRIVRLNDDTIMARSAYEEAVGRLRRHLQEHRTLTVAGARDVLGSSRRYVLPLLEWLDAQKITRRVGDDRILRD